MKTELATYISVDQVDLAIGVKADQYLLDTADSLLIRGCYDDVSLQDFADTIAALDKRVKAVTRARTNFVEPFKKDIRVVEGEFNFHRVELEDFLSKLNKAFIAYQMKRKAELEREAEARREQQRKEEAEQLAKQMAEAAERAKATVKEAEEMKLFDEEEDLIKPEPPEPPVPVKAEVLPPEKPLHVEPPKIKTESGATVKIKQEAIPIIKNKNLVPEIYKDVNIRRLTLAYEQGVHEIPGIEFVLKNKSVVR